MASDCTGEWALLRGKASLILWNIKKEIYEAEAGSLLAASDGLFDIQQRFALRLILAPYWAILNFNLETKNKIEG